MDKYTITCVICNNVAQVREKRHITCGSKQCQKDLANDRRARKLKQGKYAEQKIKVCSDCNKNYKAQQSDTNSRRCIDCRIYKKKQYKIKCVWCDKPTVVGSIAHKYCSEECSYQASQKKAYDKRERLVLENKICEFCNNEFTPNTYKAKYCKEKPFGRLCKDLANDRKRAKGLREIECFFCKVIFYHKDPQVYTCKSDICTNKRVRLSAKNRRKISQYTPRDWDKMNGYLYLVYNKDINVYKLGITHISLDDEEGYNRIREHNRIGFELIFIIHIGTFMQSHKLEQELLIELENLGCLMKTYEKKNTLKNFMGHTKGYSELIYGDDISPAKIRNMIREEMKIIKEKQWKI